MTSQGLTQSTAFRDAVDADYHSKRLGENLCPEYTSQGVGSNVLAISLFVRTADNAKQNCRREKLVEEVITSGSCSDVVDLIVLVFVTRNCRGGKGEKKLAYEIFLKVWKYFPQTAKDLLSLFIHYGYWKDLLLLSELAMKEEKSGIELQKSCCKGLVAAVLDLMRSQFDSDIAALEVYKASSCVGESNKLVREDDEQKNPKLSLLCKWLPREGTHFDKSIKFVQQFTADLWPDDVQTAPVISVEEDKHWKSTSKARYRKLVAEMTSFLDLPEVLLAARREDEIKFHKVASKATLRLSRTFLNEDAEGNERSRDAKRVRLAERFIEHLKGNKTLKGRQLMPHDIVERILNVGKVSQAMEQVLDAQWKNLWQGVVKAAKEQASRDGVEFSPTNMVPLCDVSGSMHGVPMAVSIALGIGISEITHPAFRNMVLTFESRPSWHRLRTADTIVQKVRSLEKAPWGGSTDFEAAYDLVLQVCVDHDLKRDDVPSLIVFSDMQFNEASGFDSMSSKSLETMHDRIKVKVEATATELNWSDTSPVPIVYWNLRDTGGHPADKDTSGAILLSGFSPSLLKLVMNGEILKDTEIEVVQSDGTVNTQKVQVNPQEVLRKMLDDPLYDPVRAVLVASNEGPFAAYNGVPTGKQSDVTADLDDFVVVN